MSDIDDDWENFLYDGSMQTNVSKSKNKSNTTMKIKNKENKQIKKNKVHIDELNNIVNNFDIKNIEEEIEDENDDDENIEMKINNDDEEKSTENTYEYRLQLLQSGNAPKCSKIYISTKTKISFLNKQVDIKNVFWKIPVLPYSSPTECVIKKQIKFSSTDQEEYKNIYENLKNEKYYQIQEIEHIENPEGRIKFKVQLKINVGLCKKDILNYRCKLKRAFFNCFVLILRIKDDDQDNFKEMHIKVFNTGKLEIPGIQDTSMLDKVLKLLIRILKPIIADDLDYLKDNSDTVLINSNFNCGYYVNREKLYNILKYKYGINSNYDPCSYPGIQCKFFYIPGLDNQTGKQPSANDDVISYQISFMIFRTGSVLIVGKCDENVLLHIYDFLKKLLETEYPLIGNETNVNTVKKHNIKLRKKTINVEE